VRFQRSLYDKSTGEARAMDSKIGTLEFSYKSNLSMDEKYRIENPLGFQVTSYRVDNDYAASPPLEDDAPLPMALRAALSGQTQAPAARPTSGSEEPDDVGMATAAAASVTGHTTAAGSGIR
jgi:type IV secretion system protein VirB8